jgi:molybdopterin-containing oxidoreductase family iron-sulfur binding subunit
MSDMDRRKFLKIAGLGALLGISSWSMFEVVTKQHLEAFVEKYKTPPNAMHAKRWAIVIDLKKLDEKIMNDCIEACNRIHNVPQIPNPKEEVKWIWKEDFEHAFPGMEHQYMPEEIKEMPVLVLCNHCDSPACVRVCPTKATFKRKDGIVMMDMHRCIGCRFCMAACPFGARSFNWRDPRPFIKEENKEYPTRMRGVVEKCTLCCERLEVGLPPACVEVSNGAIMYGDLADPNSEIRKLLTTRYSIRRKAELGTNPCVYYLL